MEAQLLCAALLAEASGGLDQRLFVRDLDAQAWPQGSVDALITRALPQHLGRQQALASAVAQLDLVVKVDARAVQVGEVGGVAVGVLWGAS